MQHYVFNGNTTVLQSNKNINILTSASKIIDNWSTKEVLVSEKTRQKVEVLSKKTTDSCMAPRSAYIMGFHTHLDLLGAGVTAGHWLHKLKPKFIFICIWNKEKGLFSHVVRVTPSSFQTFMISSTNGRMTRRVAGVPDLKKNSHRRPLIVAGNYRRLLHST